MDVSSKEKVALAFEKFLENENKLDIKTVSRLMSEKNIIKGLIAHYKSLGFTEKAQKLEEAWRKKTNDRKKDRNPRSTPNAPKVFGKGNRFVNRREKTGGAKDFTATRA